VTDRAGKPTGHDELRDDLAAYALGALEEDEAVRLRDHLETCEDCRRQARWLEPAVELLPMTVPQLEPPPRLRDALMRTVREESPGAVREPPDRAGTGRWAWLGRSLLRPATAVAAAAMLVIGAVTGYLISDSGESKPTLTAQAAAGAPAAAGVLEREGSSGILRVQGMPELARDEVYEVWVQRDGALEPSSLFVLRGDRSGEAAVPGSLDGADAVLVTKEPRGGSRQPTSKPVLSVRLN
jgi:anti-sigma-K factor RskA